MNYELRVTNYELEKTDGYWVPAIQKFKKFIDTYLKTENGKIEGKQSRSCEERSNLSEREAITSEVASEREAN